MQEAEISADAAPPINARQGLLFECVFNSFPLSVLVANFLRLIACLARWWSVFWVLFQAKSNGGGSEDGLVYIHVR